jgi:hypothetical protein
MSSIRPLSQAADLAGVATVAPVGNDTKAADATPAAVGPSAAAADPRGVQLASDTANALLAAQSDKPEAAKSKDEAPSVYEMFVPPLEGFSSHEFAMGISDPERVSSSAGLSDADVLKDVRARFDDKTARMAADVNKNSMEYVYSMVGDLDTRSMALVAADTSGTFSEQEKQMVVMATQWQDHLRAGGYVGSAELHNTFIGMGLSSVRPEDRAEVMRVHDGEAAKDTSVRSQLGRASARVTLGEAQSKAVFGDISASTDPNDKMLSLLLEAMTKAKETDPQITSKLQGIDTADDLKKADWFKPYVDRFNQLLGEQAANTTKAA